MSPKYPAPYFQCLNTALKEHQRAIPFLLLDLDILDKNIARLKKELNPKASFRIVLKSLPSIELVEYIMDAMSCQQLMVFHQPFLTDLSSRLDKNIDILLGKPMPVKTAQYYFDHLPKTTSGFNAFRQIQWLIDTKQRLQEYFHLANKLGQKLRLNLELDVGLHRGGFQNTEDLRNALAFLEVHREKIEFSGFMGYDPHVVKLPKLLRSQSKSLALSNKVYQEAKDLVKREFPALCHQNLCFNGAGSPTLQLHQSETSPLNDIAAGSCLVMPSTFDIATLQNYEAACFIATPVLKRFKGTTLPGLEKLPRFLNFLSRRNRQSFFIYGGFWKADYYYPPSLQQNSIFGASTNQTMLNASDEIDLEVDDFVFLRPHQSEFVFLQFGKICTIRNMELAQEWSLLKNY